MLHSEKAGGVEAAGEENTEDRKRHFLDWFASDSILTDTSTCSLQTSQKNVFFVEI